MSIEDFVQNYSRYIYRYALKLSCHPQKAEDIAQETMILVWKNIDQLKEESAIKQWARTICYRQFIDDYRKDKKEELIENIDELEQEGKMLVTSLPEPEDEVLVADSIREIQNGCFYAMVRKLTLHQRIAFSLVDMFGLSIKEVASLLEISEGAAKGLLHRARMQIDAFFSDHCNLLDEKNPCSCQAWIDFRTNHEKNQKAVRSTMDEILKDKDYKFDPKIRSKISYLYQNMPDYQPSGEWFEKIIKSF